MHACMLKAASRISSACDLARTWCLGTLCLLLVFSVSASDRSPREGVRDTFVLNPLVSGAFLIDSCKTYNIVFQPGQ